MSAIKSIIIKSFNLELAVAIILVGSLIYPVINDWLGIEYPARIAFAYGFISLIILLKNKIMANGINVRVSNIDIIFSFFIITLAASIILKTNEHKIEAFKYLIGFMLFPYLSARMLNMPEIKNVFKYTVRLGFIIIPVVIIELFSLSDYDFYDDRIKTLFGAYYTNNMVSNVLGMVSVVGISYMLRPARTVIGISNQATILSLTLVSIVLAVFIGVRSVVLSFFVVMILLTVMSNWADVKARVAISLSVILLMMLTFYNIPPKRIIFYNEVIEAAKTLINSTNEIPWYLSEPGLTEERNGVPTKNSLMTTSPQIRIVLYREALEIIRNYPIFGVGAGNFGYYSEITNKNSENAVCYNKEGLSYKCQVKLSMGSPHSTVLHAYVDLGIIGGGLYTILLLLLLLGLIKIIYKSEYKVSRNAAWILLGSGTYYFLIDQISGNYFFSVPFYIFAGVGSALFVQSRSS